MQNLLTASLSEFQAEILFWLEIAAKNFKAVEIDLSTFDAGEDANDDYSVELSNVAFYRHEDETWSSCWRVWELDEDGDEYAADGDPLASGEKSAQALVFRTLSEMATYGLSFVFEHENERLEQQADVYQPCRKRASHDSAYCGCWQCRHRSASSSHIAACCLCRSIGRTVEDERHQAIPF